MTRVIRQHDFAGGGRVVIERSALGQVAEYDVVRISRTGRRTYVGGGTKREALDAFRKAVAA